MFAPLFIVCNLISQECISVATDHVFTTEKMCNMSAEATRQEALDEIGKRGIIIYECVEFPELL